MERQEIIEILSSLAEKCTDREKAALYLAIDDVKHLNNRKTIWLQIDGEVRCMIPK